MVRTRKLRNKKLAVVRTKKRKKRRKNSQIKNSPTSRGK